MIQLTPENMSLSRWLSPRSTGASKWDFGHVLVIGGDKGFGGAVRLAGEAALRAGAGMVSVITRVAHRAGLLAGCPELMVHTVTPEHSHELCARATALVIGPGMGHGSWGAEWWTSLEHSQLPQVVDADALNALSKSPTKKNNWILTPHVREAARLLNCPVEEIVDNREKAIRALVNKYGGVVVLKGRNTLIQSTESDLHYCPLGNPGMATAGMGDVLSGLLGGLLAQKIPLLDVAKIGVYLHAMAGDTASKAGMRGMVASDLLPFVHQFVNLA
ncbi:MAG: hypothetical protein RLZ35_365 [Pseudomonadota bacterium]|jgi:NAD(P)H-hydrate epimerase